jgi:hypothetical protein
VHQTSLLASNYDIAIEACDSIPSGGLRDACGGNPAVEVSFYVNFDFEIGLGSIVPPNS